MIILGKGSLRVREELSDNLKRVVDRAVIITPSIHDWSLVEGHRPASKQKIMFDAGLSHIDGINKKGSHNYWPSKAFDAYSYLTGFGSLIPRVECYRELLKFSGLEITESNIHRAEKFVIAKMSMMNGFFLVAAEIEEVEILNGTDWDMDGNMLDHNFQDYPHTQEVIY